MKWINKFFSLNCASDVLNATGKISNGGKEISEAMAVRERVKDIVLSDRNKKYTLIDFCSGNCLIPILTAFTLPTNLNIGVDKRLLSSIRKITQSNQVQRFQFLEQDIHQIDNIQDLIPFNNETLIFSAMHACGNLSKRVIDIFINTPNAEYLILCPCCVGTIPNSYKSNNREVVNQRQLDWENYLVAYTHERVKGSITLSIDDSIPSPRNTLIIVRKEI